MDGYVKGYSMCRGFLGERMGILGCGLIESDIYVEDLMRV